MTSERKTKKRSKFEEFTLIGDKPTSFPPDPLHDFDIMSDLDKSTNIIEELRSMVTSSSSSVNKTFIFVVDTQSDLDKMHLSDLGVIIKYLDSMHLSVDIQVISKEELDVSTLMVKEKTILLYNGHGTQSPDEKDIFPSFIINSDGKMKIKSQTNIHNALAIKMGSEIKSDWNNIKLPDGKLLVTIFNCCNNSSLNEDISLNATKQFPNIFDFVGNLKICSSQKGELAYYKIGGSSMFISNFFGLFKTNYEQTILTMNKLLRQQAQAHGVITYCDDDDSNATLSPNSININTSKSKNKNFIFPRYMFEE